VILRSWGGRVPLDRAEAFVRHLSRTGVADYRRRPGCREVRLLRRDHDGWAHFQLESLWTDMGAIRAYAGERPERAVLYPDDERFGLVPDATVTHFELVALEPEDPA
jgi:quinol monooxygenase YgiN